MIYKNLLIVFLFSLLSTISYANTRISSAGYIIKFKNNKSLNTSDFCRDYTNCNKISRLNMISVKELPKSFQKTSDILYVQPNYIYHALETPTDPLFSKQWGMKKIKAELAWDLFPGSEDMVVAVIDTGVDYTHPDLADNTWTNDKELHGTKGVDDDGNGYIDDIRGYDFANKDSDPIDDHGHGTHCAGVIGAVHNDIGVVGINKDIKIMALKFLTAEGSGSSEGAISAIIYAVDNGAKVLSNSWGGGPSEQALMDAITYAKSKGVLFIAASGNESNNNDTNPSYPASYKIDNVISVAASDSSDRMASFSNYGLSVHIAAPGVGITSTVKGGTYQSMDGTSMACPHVAGAAALMMAYEPNMTYKEVKDRIIMTSDYVPAFTDFTYTAGRLNLINMLKNVQPQRPLPPDETKWVSITTEISSPHPYTDKQTYEYSITVPAGYKMMRVHFSKFDTEAKYDVVSVGGKDYSGKLGDFLSKAFAVNSGIVKLKFVSDVSVSSYGFDVDFIQVQ